jgi:hypothetical protein
MVGLDPKRRCGNKRRCWSSNGRSLGSENDVLIVVVVEISQLRRIFRNLPVNFKSELRVCVVAVRAVVLLDFMDGGFLKARVSGRSGHQRTKEADASVSQSKFTYLAGFEP